MTTVTRPLETGWLDDTPVGDSLLRRFLHNQADLTADLARCGGGEVLRRADVVCGWYDTPVLYNCQAVLLQPPTDESLAAVEQFFSGRSGTLLSAWPLEPLPGWELMGHPMLVVKAPGMLPVKDSGRLQVCSTPEELAVAEQVAVEGYPLPGAGSIAANSCLAEGLLDTPYLVRLGSHGGRPVSVAASYVAHDVVNLCLAATLPEARRQGVWSDLVAARCNDEPHLPAAAFTSDDSRPGFVAMGFLPVMRTTFLVRP